MSAGAQAAAPRQRQQPHLLPVPAAQRLALACWPGAGHLGLGLFMATEPCFCPLRRQPENLLLDLGSTDRPLVKLADFGCSKHVLESSAKSGVGERGLPAWSGPGGWVSLGAPGMAVAASMGWESSRP